MVAWFHGRISCEVHSLHISPRILIVAENAKQFVFTRMICLHVPASFQILSVLSEAVPIYGIYIYKWLIVNSGTFVIHDISYIMHTGYENATACSTEDWIEFFPTFPLQYYVQRYNYTCKARKLLKPIILLRVLPIFHEVFWSGFKNRRRSVFIQNWIYQNCFEVTNKFSNRCERNNLLILFSVYDYPV